MSRLKVRGWKLLLPLATLALAAAAFATVAFAGSSQNEVRIAIFTDCKGAFGFAYEYDIGGAQAAFAEYAGGKPKNKKKPSAGMTNINVAGKNVRIVGYACGDDTPATILKEVRRLMQQQNADVMVGPLSGDEAVAVANWAKNNPRKTVVIGTAGSQDPTLQIAPKNLFRYHGDGAQWNAGIGEVVYKRLGWRNAAIIMDDYSFGWTSGAGIIADFCAIGGKITKRVFPPLNTTDYAPYVRQLPAPGTVDGYFWVVGGTGTGASLKAFEQAYGALDPKQHAGNLFFAFLGADKEVAPKVVGAYVGGSGTGPGLKTRTANAYRAIMKKWYPDLPADDLFVFNYFQAARALLGGLSASGGAVGPALQAKMPKTLSGAYQISNNGLVKLDANRQAVQDQYMLQIVQDADGTVRPDVVGYIPGVDQSFGGLFKKSSPPPGRTQPPCVKKNLPWQGKIRVVKNGVVTKQVIK